MRLDSAAHTAQPWRIHQLAPDFRVEDVWQLPISGTAEDFGRVVRLITMLDPSETSFVVRALFEVRWKLGAVLGWDAAESSPVAGPDSLVQRLPDDLRTRPGPFFDQLPFTPLYLTDTEYAAEVANRTMHGVMHLGWVPDDEGRFRAQLAVLVKPNGRLGRMYMAAIKPFRYLIVYPSIMRHGERTWRTWQALDRTSATPTPS